MLSVCFSKATRASRESIHSTKPDLTSRTSLRSTKSSPKQFLRVVSTTKEPTAQAEYPVSILTNKRVSRRGIASFLLEVFWIGVLQACFSL